MSAPMREIVYRAGKTRTVVFECGHMDSVDGRRKRDYCWDCFYNNPVPEMGKVILEEIKEGAK